MPSLIGNKPNQVPTNGDLGTLAFQDASNILAGTISTTGNVGIGTSSPVAKLDIAGGNLNIDNAYWLRFGGSNTVFSSSAVGGLLIQSPSGAENTIFRTSGGTERMRIDSSGNVGIGTTSPAYKLHNYVASGSVATVTQTASASAGNTASIRLLANTYNYGLYVPDNSNSLVFYDYGQSTERMRIDSAGNVGIGTSSPSKKLDVNGDALISGLTVGKGENGVAQNTAIGFQALSSGSLSGNFNVALGYQSLLANTTGAFNHGLGRLALTANTTGQQNVAIGNNSLGKNTSGSFNIGIGSATLVENLTTSNNVAIGQNSMNKNVADNNTAVGAFSLDANTTGTENSAFGNFSLSNSTTGSYNTALGSGSLQLNTTASNNTAVGYQAGYTNTVSSYHTFLGFQAGYSTNNTYGHITAIGNAALYSNTTGLGSTAIGSQALYSNVGGNYNVAVGGTDGLGTLAALRSNTSGGSNTAVGVAALGSNTTASNNTAVGYQAGYAVTTGAYNTYVGWQAGDSATTGNNNTFIGLGSGNAVTTGGKNTILGGYTGNNSGLDIRTASNYIVLSDGDGNPLISTYNGGTTALKGAVPNAGTGITFPSTQSASSDANTLDDYEEGSWTPSFTGSGSNPTITYGNRVGSYTKVGRLVTCIFRIQATSASGGSGNLQISGLPFSMLTGQEAGFIPMQANTTATSNRYVQLFLTSGLTYATVYNNDPNGAFGAASSPPANNFDLIGSISYFTS